MTTGTRTTRGDEVAALVARGRLTYTVEEAAELLGVSRGAAYAAVRAGNVPADGSGGGGWCLVRGSTHG